MTRAGAGRLAVISGPSGSGKSTICRILARDPQVWLSVSATSRPPRPGEVDGRHYHFLSREEFDRQTIETLQERALTALKDRKAIDRILALDAEGLIRTVDSEAITMCGYGPVSAMLRAGIKMGAKKAELLKYATSGDTAGPMSEVVGYASIVVSR